MSIISLKPPKLLECLPVCRSSDAPRSLSYAIVLLLLSNQVTLAADKGRLAELKQLSIEELVNMEVSVASNTPQRLADTAAAVFVITETDIRRSGVTTIPELLRMVPGVQVARMDANKWAITARGFNGRFANKLLVLMDGRTVYSPTFSGVYWDIQDTLLEDIKRIEVVRGPGAAVWGANAVNGVINIITKQAELTQGGLVAATSGNEQQGIRARYGGSLGDQGHYRGYVKYTDHDAGESPDGVEDDWHDLRAGFRADTVSNNRNELSLIGNVYQHEAGQRISLADLQTINRVVDDRTESSGANLLGRWSQILDNNDTSELQIYYDYIQHEEITFDTTQHIFDIDYHYRLQQRAQHQISWGLGYRHLYDKVEKNAIVSFEPEQRHDNLYSGFIEDRIHLFDERLLLTLGSKLEHNDYTGWEIQPNIRALWRQESGGAWWGSISRAVRTPSRAEHDARFDQLVLPAAPPFVPLPVLVRVVTNDDYKSEKLIAYELGYRKNYSPNLQLDASIFYNDYEDLRSAAAKSTTTEFSPTPHLVQELVITNDLAAVTYGLELNLDWRPTENLRIQPAYSYIDIDIDPPDEQNVRTPEHQFSLRTSIDLSRDWELDFWLRYVDEISDIGIDDYTELDIRLAWQVNRSLSVELVGRNLLSDSHAEFIPEDVSTTTTEVEREFYLQAQLRF